MENFTDQLQENISSSIEEDTALKSENHYALESENQIIIRQVPTAIKVSINMQSDVQILEFFHNEKIPNSDQQSNILQESTITQVNDLKSKICNEKNA